MSTKSPPVVADDEHGSPIVLIRKHHLEAFPTLVAWLRKHEYVSNSGICKLRLHPDDCENDRCLNDILPLMKVKFETMRKVGKRNIYYYNPDAQMVYRASRSHHIYEYTKAKCTVRERKDFVKAASDLVMYTNGKSNCCMETLQNKGINGLREHLFSVIENLAPLKDNLKGERSETDECSSATVPPIIYGAGISLDPDHPVKICGDFSMSKLNSVLDHLKEEYDGITYPYYYCGSLHSFFPWHIEDGGTFSINYIFEGKPKLWFGIDPKYFGFVDLITSGLHLDALHAACRAVLSDHKTLVADPEYFLKIHGVPYSVTVQEPGDFIVTFPYSLHSGFNLGQNLAVAGNFADADWIELGMYAPVCACSKTQVQLNLTEVIRKCRPQLLHTYLDDTQLIFPPNHPREVRRPLPRVDTPKAVVKQVLKQDGSTVLRLYQNPLSLKNRTVSCPECNQGFTGNKISRLKSHIIRVHSAGKQNLLRIVDIEYPPWTPKTAIGSTCNVCMKFIRGSKTHLTVHVKKCHPDECLSYKM